MNDQVDTQVVRRQGRAIWPPPRGVWVWAAVAVAVAVTATLLHGWRSGFITACFNWTRKGTNAGAVQAITAVAALLATLALLVVTWWQARIARDAAARQLEQSREAARAAWDSAERDHGLSQQAIRDARDEAWQARRDDRERTVRAVMPMLVWRELTVALSPGGGVGRVRFMLSNAGAGPAVTANLLLGNGNYPEPVGLGHFTLRPGEELPVDAPLPGLDAGRQASPRYIKPEQPHDVPGHFSYQFFAAYRDIYGTRFGSRVDLYWHAQPARFVLGPVVFQEIPDMDDTIDTLRRARIVRPR